MRNGDYIAAVVNQELVTAGEVERRLERAKADALRAGQKPPADDDLRRQVTDALIEERVIVTSARESGVRVDEPEIDRAVQSVATQNQISLEVLRERLRSEGVEYSRFRANLRDQMLMERMREREVRSRRRDVKGVAILRVMNPHAGKDARQRLGEIGRASCRERVLASV